MHKETITPEERLEEVRESIKHHEDQDVPVPNHLFEEEKHWIRVINQMGELT
jgi:hypothetical protein